MSNRLLQVGFSNRLDIDRVLAVLTPASAPTVRLVHQARDTNQLVDLTNGRKTRSVVVFDNGYVGLLGISPKALIKRLEDDSGRY